MGTEKCLVSLERHSWSEEMPSDTWHSIGTSGSCNAADVPRQDAARVSVLSISRKIEALILLYNIDRLQETLSVKV